MFCWLSGLMTLFGFGHLEVKVAQANCQPLKQVNLTTLLAESLTVACNYSMIGHFMSSHMDS